MMTRKKQVLCYLVLMNLFFGAVHSGVGQELSDSYDPSNDPAMWKVEEYVVLNSSKDYKSAKKFAQKTAKKLDIPLDLRGLLPHSKIGLTNTEEGCQDNGYTYPCYVSRELENEEIYLSIEHSSAYNFTPGYYIVLGAVGPPKSVKLRKALKVYKSIVPDAYIKQSNVYLGCRH